jgi:preprotein translocase subunit SecG
MLDLFHTPITVLHVIVCLMLMLVVLIQPGKSGGLGAALGGAGAQQIFGGRGAGNFLTRTTWIAATIFFVTSVTLAYVSTSTGDSLEDLANQPAPAPAAPADEPSKAPVGATGTAEPTPAAPAAAGEAPAPGSVEPGSVEPSGVEPVSPDNGAQDPAAPAQP